VVVVAFPTPETAVDSNSADLHLQPAARPSAAVSNPVASSLSAFLSKYGVTGEHRDRVAHAIAASSRKYNLDPWLVASIMIVESRADPFAISTRSSIGIMQIHVPTWGQTVDKEGINLFKIEDNVDFGTRILRDYVRRHGLWEGVRRYKGWHSEIPESIQSADDYAQRIQRIYTSQSVAAKKAAISN
jgi:soluble lytic murein transglycosylase-like protein